MKNVTLKSFLSGFALGFIIITPRAFGQITTNTSPVSISASELKDFSDNSQAVKKLLTMALKLAARNLGYQYGSADPINGGMDCSGTIHYLLSNYGMKNIPRSSDMFYQWVLEKGHLHLTHAFTLSSPEFSALTPGDLLFWNGTYEIKRKLDVTHVMLYLGKNHQGEPLIIGASNGRTYKGKKIYGVSVFDFSLPGSKSRSHFLGYSCIPGINCHH